MRPSSKIGKRYAKGLWDYALTTTGPDAYVKDMEAISETLQANPDLKNFLGAPFIDTKKKQIAVAEIFKTLQPGSLNFLNLIIKQGREKHIGEIAQFYINQFDESKGLQIIKLSLAQQLSESAIQSILSDCTLVHNSLPQKVEVLIKPELIGGYIIRVGDKQIDNSVKNKLSNVKKEFLLGN